MSSMQHDKKQLIEYMVSLDTSRRTPAMITAIMALADEGKGRGSIRDITGYGEKTIRKVLGAYRAWNTAQAGADATAAFVARPSDGVVSEQSAEPDGSDWLFNDRYLYNEMLDNYVTFISASPKPLVVPGAKHRAMKTAYSNWSGNASTMNEICRTFGMPRNWFNLYRAAHQWTHDSEPFTDEEVMTRPVEEMVADALQLKKLNLHQRYEKEKWADIKRDADKWNRWTEIEKPQLQEYIASIATKAPRTLVIRNEAQEPFAVFAGVFNDLHWGKFASPEETRSPYNRQIALDRILSACERLINDVLKTGVPERWILPIGGDLMHVDNPNHTTSAGTKQDVDGTFREIARSCNEMVIQVLNMFLQVAPVDLYPERGNHDEVASFNIGEFVRAWYRSNGDVTVNAAMQERQYAVYGSTLIGISHGDKSKPDALVRKLMSEVRPLYTKTDHHIIFTAHLHSIYAQEVDGVIVMRRPCLSGSDIWHSQNGYEGNQICISAMFIDRERGPYHHLLAAPTRGL